MSTQEQANTQANEGAAPAAASVPPYFRAYLPSDPDLQGMLAGKDFVAFDLETTGFCGDQGDQITQVAAVLIDGTTLTEKGEPFARRARLNSAHMERLRVEVSSPVEPDSSSLHFVLALNGHHPLNKLQIDILRESLSAGMITEQHFRTLSRETPRKDRRGEYADGNPKYVKYQALHQLTPDEMLDFEEAQKALPKEEDVLRELQSWMSGHGSIRAIGQNAYNFDKPFWNHRLRAHGMPEQPLRVTDTMWLSRLLFLPALRTMAEMGDEESSVALEKLGALKDVDRLSSKLQDLRAALHVEGGEAHSAIGDVQTMVGVLRGMCSFLQKHRESLTREEGLEAVLFARYKMQALERHYQQGFRY